MVDETDYPCPTVNWRSILGPPTFNAETSSTWTWVWMYLRFWFQSGAQSAMPYRAVLKNPSPVQLSYPTISGILWRRWCTLCFRKKRLGTYVWSWANLVGASHKPKESFCLLLAIGYLEGLQDPCPMANRYINASWLVAKFNANWNTCICHSYLFLPRHDARVLNPHEWSIHVAFTHLC